MQIVLTMLLITSVVTLTIASVSEGARLFQQQRRPRLTREGLSRLLREWGALTFSAVTTPLALLPSAPAQPLGSGADHPPVLLVPGYGLSRIIMLPLAAYLRRRQRRWVWAINNPVWRDDIPAFAAALSEAVDAMRRLSGADRIDIVGHSMGGLVAAWYITQQGGAEKTHRLVTLGTPWRGTHMHIFGLGRQCRSMAPTSPLLAQLQSMPVPTVTLWSDRDAVILPNISATTPGAQAVLLAGQGHTSMPLGLVGMRAVEAALTERGEE